jgi:predicted Holliday junction resolvase-like endonuclease
VQRPVAPTERAEPVTAGWLLLAVVVALVAVTSVYARRRVTHPFTKEQVDAARAQSRMLSRTSRDGVGGENVAPWMPGFPFEPRDASFLGNPVDYVVFDGLDEGELREIVFVEVKTGQSGMTKRGQQIRRAVQDGRVSHRLVRLARTETQAVVRAVLPARPRKTPPRDDTTAA